MLDISLSCTHLDKEFPNVGDLCSHKCDWHWRTGTMIIPFVAIDALRKKIMTQCNPSIYEDGAELRKCASYVRLPISAC
jgi:hypothetical protein